MAGFKEGYLQLRKKDIGTASDQNFIKFGIGTDFSPYTIDEFGIKRSLAAAGRYSAVGSSTTPLPEIVDLLNGQGMTSDITCRLYASPDFTGDISEYSVSGTTLSFIDGQEQYVCVKYNSGVPIYYVEDYKNNINGSSVALLYIVWRQGNELHTIGMDSLALGLSNKIAESIQNTQLYRKSIEGGLVLSEVSTRQILITSACVYAGVVKQPVSAFDSRISATNTLTEIRYASGVISYVNVSAYNNSNYTDGMNMLVLGNNKYSVKWVYRSIGDANQVFYHVGKSEHNNIEAAKLETPPTITLPKLIRHHCVLVGRIIIEKNASSGLVENVQDSSFISEQVSNHNDLSNIQGGIPGEYYHLTLSEKNVVSNLSASQEPTGFPTLNQSKLLFNDTTRTFTISALNNTFDVFYRGNKFTKPTESIQISNTSGLHFIYYTSAGTLTESTTPWDIATTIQISDVYWTGTSSFGPCEERHGCVMDWATHLYAHKNFGTQYTSGFTATYTLNSHTSANFGLTNGTISDEDLELYISQGVSGNYLTQQLNYPGYIPVYYRAGNNGVGSWRKDSATVFPYKKFAGNGVNYNLLSGSNWVQQAVTNNYYVAYFIYATDTINEPIISVQGQRQDINLSNSQENNLPNNLILSDFPVAEAKLLYRIILETKTAYTGNVYLSRIVDVTDYRNSSINLVQTGSTGTVTSVGISANPILEISNSPVVNAGTISIDFSATTSGGFFAGPNSGTPTRPSFRKILINDLPIDSLNSIYLPLSGGTLTGLLRGTTISASGNISATSFVKSGGTSTQFLKANGSVDSNSYALNSAVSGTAGQVAVFTGANSVGGYLGLDYVLSGSRVQTLNLGSSTIGGPASTRLNINQTSNAAGGGEIFLGAAGTSVGTDEHSGKLIFPGARIIGRTTGTQRIRFQVADVAGTGWENLLDIQGISGGVARVDIPTGLLSLGGQTRISAGGQGIFAGVVSTKGDQELFQARRSTSVVGSLWGYDFQAQMVDANYANYARIQARLGANTVGAQSGSLQLSVLNAGTQTKIAEALTTGWNVATGSIQINETTTITSARGGDFTALKVGSTTGFVRSVAGTYSASPLVSGDFPTLQYLPLTGGTLTGNLTFNDDGEGVFFNGGAAIYKKSGTGIVVRLHSANTNLQIENNSGTSLGSVWYGTGGTLNNLNQLTNGPGYITASSLGAYLPLSGGSINSGGQITVTRDITPSTTSNALYIQTPLVIQRAANSGTTTVAGIGFHNPGVNGSVLYYDPAVNYFKYFRHTAGSLVTVWDSSNLTNLNQLTNGPGYVTGGPYIPIAGGVTATSAVIFGNAKIGRALVDSSSSRFGHERHDAGNFNGFYQNYDGSLRIATRETTPITFRLNDINRVIIEDSGMTVNLPTTFGGNVSGTTVKLTGPVTTPTAQLGIQSTDGTSRLLDLSPFWVMPLGEYVDVKLPSSPSVGCAFCIFRIGGGGRALTVSSISSNIAVSYSGTSDVIYLHSNNDNINGVNSNDKNLILVWTGTVWVGYNNGNY